MTVSLDHIREKLIPHFPEVEQVDESVLHFERRSHGNAYAVCYVDVSKEIPDSVDALNSYQDRVVARRYFQGRKSLQWSNYVYFVVDEQPPQSTKLIVERNRKYARKYVLTEPELDTALSPPSFKVSDAVLKTDILTTWINILADAQLDRAILNDESLPRRLELIEAFFSQRAASPPTANVVPRVTAQPFLRQITLKNFRLFPVLREFDLGTVTLICGANGTGKTSLMEAIELVYCGRNKRNPQTIDDYTIIAKYADGTEENATHRRPATVFRGRNLVWFGQSEQRTSNLFQTFSRFNFLNTDAAVGLAEAKDELEEDLSKLLVGPEASKTWREIERTAGKLDDKIKELRSLLNQAELEEASLNRQIAALGELKQESGAVLKKLDDVLASVGCRQLGQPTGIAVPQLLKLISEAHEANTKHIQMRERLIGELTALEASGLRIERYEELLASVSSRHPVPSIGQIQEECNQLEQARTKRAAEREDYRIKNQEMLGRAAEAVAATEATGASVDSALAQLKEQLASTKGILTNLERCVADFPCPADRPLSELAISIRVVRTLSGDYQATHSKEQSTMAVLAETSNRKKQLETQIAGLRPRIERFVDARKALSKIQNEHSLSGAMEEALRQNRIAIEDIFARIHSPAEFSGLGDTLTTLVRKDGGEIATLQQISTGQRAAFALSLFLAQNAQLRTAPPLILVDDPIAHADDLNCLSFLDYLREVVVAGDRQVVFATADEKLAALFERKFDFLGEVDFRRYDLSR